jgi:hypothetical protein
VGPHPVGRTAVNDRVDPRLAAERWCAYAWPVVYGRSGRLTFFVDQDGDVRCTDDPRYSGDSGPLPGAAFADGGPESIVGTVPDAGAASQDGNVWGVFGAR